MIVSLRAKVLEVEADQVVLETGGVGLGVSVPGRIASVLSQRVGDEVRLHTYLHVRDDALQLYGFQTARERAFFLSLIAVSGVGPKVGLAVLSTFSVEQLEAAIVRGDSATFESVPGVGHKLAQRLVIELKDRVAMDLEEAMSARGAAAPGGDHFVEARAALQGLGLTLREAEAALKGAPADGSVEELVRHALRKSETGQGGGDGE